MTVCLLGDNPYSQPAWEQSAPQLARVLGPCPLLQLEGAPPPHLGWDTEPCMLQPCHPGGLKGSPGVHRSQAAG